MSKMGNLGRIYGLREGVEDPGAAQDAIGELADLVENWQTMDQSRVKAMLFSWFKQNETVIRQALGLEGTDVDQWRESKLPEADDGDDFLAQEGGPGSGRRPGPSIGVGAVSGPPEMPPPGADASDEVYPMDGEDEDDAPSPGASGLPSDVMKKLRDVIQSLESLVPDEDPEGDAPAGDDMPFDMSDEDEPAPPKPKKAPEKKSEKSKPSKSKGDGKDEKPDDEVDEARSRRRPRR